MTSWAERLGVFDLETTGVDTGTARIVTAFVGELGGAGEVLSRNDWVIDPMVEIPEAAAAVHGYTTERVQEEGMAAQAGVAQIIAALRGILAGGVPVVAYNAAYDFTVLDREALRYGIPPLEPTLVVDPLVIDKALDRYRRGKRTLEFTAATYGVRLDDAHDAGADAIAAGRVAQALAAKYGADLDLSAAELHARQIAWSADQAASYQEYRRSRGETAFVTSGAWPLR
ncbi:exonuclease domain-containing protein [Gryllotalpicola sp.]|uniref:exonuclease domain-containing protein n=1 Tax=Gryllotalpicola sp. TaxID=1932787 RepID=UPI00261A4512|nr:exonuclease domain-containing protein [Gryllotalpicola sp.]